MALHHPRSTGPTDVALRLARRRHRRRVVRVAAPANDNRLAIGRIARIALRLLCLAVAGAAAIALLVR